MPWLATRWRRNTFTLNPRLTRGVGDLRIHNWGGVTLGHARHRLDDATCYWHLTAVTTSKQSQGYAAGIWTGMAAHARIRTSVVARNHRSVKWYAQLRFRSSPLAAAFPRLRKR